MRFLIKLLYKKYRTDFLDLMVQDLLEDIPENISEPALSILGEKKRKIERFLLFQASILQRRLAKNPKDAERNLGMLVQIKLWIYLLDKLKVPNNTEKTEDVKTVAQYQREQQEKLDKENKVIEAFKQRRKTLSTEK